MEAKLNDPSERIMLVVSVIDTGLGISEADQKKLFQLFGKLKASKHLNQQGVGLGLTICKKISEFMGGLISVKSKENEGSTFTFSIKIEKTRNLAR